MQIGRRLYLAALLTGIGHVALAAPTVTTREIVMRDGTHLVADVLLPSATGHYPAIMEVTPYGRGPEDFNFRAESKFWNDHGFAFVSVDSRGTGSSGGTIGLFNTPEARDGADVIRWITRQGWSDGKVGLRGASYTGTAQWYYAAQDPPGLKCMMPSATFGPAFHDNPYPGGAFSAMWPVNWLEANAHAHKPPQTEPPHPDIASWVGHHPLGTFDIFAAGRTLPLYQDVLRHPTMDAFWQDRAFDDAHFSKIHIPALAFTGWFDGLLPGTVWHFDRARQLSSARKDQFVIIGPYTHVNAADGGYDHETRQAVTRVGNYQVPPAGLLPARKIALEFFNWCLKDGARPAWKPVRLFVVGADRWISSDSFPLPATQYRSLFLTSGGHANGSSGDGRLVWNAPAGPADRYLHDPANPISSEFSGRGATRVPVDMAPVLKRQDILVYTSAPLAKAMTIIGNVSVDLKVATTARDADFVINMFDVAPDGTSTKLGPRPAEQIRGRYLGGFDRERPLVPGRLYHVRLQAGPIGYQFPAGHSLRLMISSSFFPWISVNSGTGKSIATDVQAILATQTVFHDKNRISKLTLPIVENPHFEEPGDLASP